MAKNEPKPQQQRQAAPPTPPPQAVAPAGAVVRQDFKEIERTAETAGVALAAQSRAMVEARFVMALRRPRDWDEVRSKLLRACERPGFAGHLTEKVWGAAWYRKPVGEGVEGFSIRFAEEAVRSMGNIDVQTVTVYDDDTKRILTVTVTDLEDNNSYPTSINITKTVERKFLKKGETAIRVRVNSEGTATYIVEATEEEVFMKQQNLASRAIRNGVLRLLPGDIQAECRNRILAIRHGEVAKDPDKVRKSIVDAFAGLNVQPAGLKDLLGHDLATSTPAELADLRDLYSAIKGGQTNWQDVLNQAKAERGEPTTGEEPAEDAAEKKTGLGAVTARLKAKPKAGDQKPDPKADLDAKATAIGAEVLGLTPEQIAADGEAVNAEPIDIDPEDEDVAGLFDLK